MGCQGGVEGFDCWLRVYCVCRGRHGWVAETRIIWMVVDGADEYEVVNTNAVTMHLEPST